jgi:hypothetical protein
MGIVGFDLSTRQVVQAVYFIDHRSSLQVYYLGFCPSGYYSSSSGQCAQSPAGYFKPRVSFSDNVYICGAGYYSVPGSTACSSCSYSATLGTSSCPSLPTMQPTAQPTNPTGQPSSRPSSCPSAQPTNPTGQPSAKPSRQPTAHPTSQPTSTPTAFCRPGTYTKGGMCTLAPIGLSLKTTLPMMICACMIEMFCREICRNDFCCPGHQLYHLC